jgi:mannose-6-phosphate isomerase-like protein (cupin superfamily)
MTDKNSFLPTQPPSYFFLGAKMVVHLSGAQTDGQYSLIEGFMPPGGDGGLHVHLREDEALHMLEGELQVTAGAEVFTLKPGQSCFVPRGTPHRVRNNSTAVARAMLVHTPGTFDAFITKAGMTEEQALAMKGPPSPEQIAALIELAESYGTKVLEAPEL